MRLPTGDGIACDLCGLGCRHDFTYYSYDFKLVEVYNNRRSDLDSIISSPIIFSLDVCPTCFDTHKKATIANYAKIMSPQRRVVIGVMCDLSGKLMVGTYNYYYVSVTKVEVRGAQKAATIKTDERHVELNVTEEIYKGLTSSAGVVRKVAGEWSTHS